MTNRIPCLREGLTVLILLVLCPFLPKLAVLASLAPEGDPVIGARTTLPDSSVGEVKGIFVDKASGRPLGVVPNLLRDREEGEVPELNQARMNAMEIQTDSAGAFHWVKVPTGFYHVFTFQQGLIGEGFSVGDGEVVDLGVVEVGK
jgi:hypothetical protein